MRKIFTLVSVTLFSVTAFAQAGDKAPAKPAEAKPPEMAGPPKPAPEMVEMTKGMVGVWKCSGKFTMGGKEQKDSSKMTFTSELGGFFIGARLESPKSKDNPMGYSAKSLMGYDPATKMFMRSGGDSWGGMEMAQSKGWEGDAQVWTGKSKMMGQDMDMKETVTRKGPREVSIAGSAGGAAGMSWETSCKK